MFHEVFLRSWVPGVILWSAAFATHQWLSAVNARLYRGGAREVFEWAGSAALEARTSEFAWHRVYAGITLVGIAALLAVVWLYARELEFWKSLYFAILGSCTLPVCTSGLRLMNNLLIFRGTRDGRSVVGKIRFSEAFVRRASSAGLLSYAGLYLLLAMIAGDWFCLGECWAACSPRTGKMNALMPLKQRRPRKPELACGASFSFFHSVVSTSRVESPDHP